MKIGIIESIQSESLVADFCKYCKQVRELKLSFVQKIFVLGFPAFPTGRFARVTCTCCKAEIPLYDVPVYVYKKHDQIYPTIKTPLWTYSLAIIMGVMLVVAMIWMPIEEKKLKDMIDKPLIGDVYEIEIPETVLLFHTEKYTLWKVVGLSDDNIRITTSILEVNKARDISKLYDTKDDEKWSSDTITYSRLKLKEYVGIHSDHETIRIKEISRAGAK